MLNLNPILQTLAGKACAARLRTRAAREGMTPQQFGLAYRNERGWGDPAVASLMELWAQGTDQGMWQVEYTPAVGGPTRVESEWDTKEEAEEAAALLRCEAPSYRAPGSRLPYREAVVRVVQAAL